jgi:hypothetical protein
MAQFVEALRYKSEDRGFDSPMVSLEFFIDIILPAALWLLGSTRPLTEMSNLEEGWVLTPAGTQVREQMRKGGYSKE